MSTQRRLDEFELNLLNTALKKCSAEALKFISPIISLDSVQKLLFSCLIENSRSLEEWIWEPKVRHIITQLRDQNPHLDASNNHLDLIYHKASDELSLVDSLVQQNEEDILKQVEDIRSEGKRKFQEENFYAAMNSFKKCIDLLVQYHNAEEDEENTFEPGDWSSHMRDFYVTCCCNIAICAIKLKQLSEIREFSSKALHIDPASSKALYALAKLHLFEHLYDDAIRVVEKALEYHPENKTLKKMKREIESTISNMCQREHELSSLAQLSLEAAKQPAEESKESHPPKTARPQVPLPHLIQDNQAAGRLYKYLQQTKRCLVDQYEKLYDPEKGEHPLFRCDLSDSMTGMVLAENIQASSKKNAKNLAAFVGIQKIWELAQKEGKLLPEDDLHWDAYQQSLKEVKSLSPPKEQLIQEQQTKQSDKHDGPVKISTIERTLEPVMLLNQLQAQGRLQVQFEFEDLVKDPPEFECRATLIANEQIQVETRAASKKKARSLAAQQILGKAIEEKVIIPYKEQA